MDTESSQKKVGLDKHMLSLVSSSSSLSPLWLSWLSSWSSLSSLLYGLQPPCTISICKSYVSTNQILWTFRLLMAATYKPKLQTYLKRPFRWLNVHVNELWNELEKNISLYCTMCLCDMILYMFSIPWTDSQPFLRARKPQLWHEESLNHKFAPLDHGGGKSNPTKIPSVSTPGKPWWFPHFHLMILSHVVHSDIQQHLETKHHRKKGVFFCIFQAP